MNLDLSVLPFQSFGPSIHFVPCRYAFCPCQVCLNYVDVAVTVASLFELTSRVFLLPVRKGEQRERASERDTARARERERESRALELSSDALS